MGGWNGRIASSVTPMPSSWEGEAGNLVRAGAGGLLVGVPLLFSLEVWDIGSSATPPDMAIALVLTLVAVSLLVHTSGFRRSMEVKLSGVLRETVEAVAVGVVAVTGVLVLFREITLRTPFADALGKIVYEAAPFAIGAAVACHLLDQSPDETDGDATSREHRGGSRGTVADLGSTFVGALFVGFNIAPTVEIPRLAAASSPATLLATMAASLLISYAIVFQAGFRNQAMRREQRGVLQHPATETAVSYLLALATSAAMLLFFGIVHPGDPWPVVLGHVVILGLPAAIGGAAGRLAV